MRVNLTFTAPWANRSCDLDLQIGPEAIRVGAEGQADGQADGFQEHRLGGAGSYELLVPETGLVVHLPGPAQPAAPARWKSGQLEVCLQLSETRRPTAVAEVLLPMGGPEGHLQLQALPSSCQGLVGLRLWPCCFLLGAWLRRAFARQELPRRLLELGSGQGAGGLQAAAHGAEVLLSDCEGRLLPLLRRNAADVARRCNVATPDVRRLDFGQDQDVQDLVSEGQFDLVLASDVLYEHRLVPKLLQAAKALTAASSGSTRLVLALELRPCGVKLEEALASEAEKRGWASCDATEELQLWVTPMPEEMQVPPLEPRHRLLLLGPGPFAASPPTPKAAAAPAARRPWEGAGEEEWYSRSMQFWAQQEVSCSGVLGGRPDTHLPDLHASEAFLDGVLRQRQTRLQTALDCGAGVGRLAEALLLPRVETVDLLEPSGALLEAARHLPARHFLQRPLQSREKLPDSYDLIWVQWVLLYLTDADLVAVLRRLRKALRPGGCLVVKENVLLNRSAGLVHERDSSLTRTDGHFRRLFAEAQLTLRCSAAQEPWPSELLPVMMYALE
ncbi:unnamed protein product [Effrenium voratum]|nr:unnamed protein product [Effrenium voratum]